MQVLQGFHTGYILHLALRATLCSVEAEAYVYEILEHKRDDVFYQT
jgi:hypothetical protein